MIPPDSELFPHERALSAFPTPTGCAFTLQDDTELNVAFTKANSEVWKQNLAEWFEAA